MTLVRPNVQGAFVVRGLPPGQYYAAVVGALVGGQWQDPEYLRAILRNGGATSFSLSEAEAKTLPLTVVR